MVYMQCRLVVFSNHTHHTHTHTNTYKYIKCANLDDIISKLFFQCTGIQDNCHNFGKSWVCACGVLTILVYNGCDILYEIIYTWTKNETTNGRRVRFFIRWKHFQFMISVEISLTNPFELCILRLLLINCFVLPPWTCAHRYYIACSSMPRSRKVCCATYTT